MTAVILEAALRSLVLALLVRLGLAMLRVRNPHIGKAVWTTVLLGALGMPLLMKWPLPQAIPLVSVADVSIGAALSETRTQISPYTLIYSAVLGVLLLRLAIAFVRLWHIRRRAGPVQERWAGNSDIRVTSEVLGPMTFGRTILLPPEVLGWSEAKRATILAHEREHVRTHDCEVQWLACLHLCIFWFSPLSWWLRRHLGALAEDSSDDAALATADPAEYAELLLEAAGLPHTPRVAIGIASGPHVARRITRALSEGTPASVPARWRCALAAALVLPAVVFAAGVASVKVATLAAQPQQDGASEPATEPSSTRAYIVSSNPADKWYPTEALRKGIQGMARVAVTLDATGRLTDMLVVSETPQGVGFGAAAAAAARSFTYANPTRHPTTLAFNVRFELSQPGHLRYGTTNFEGH
jgi:TonB family protein